jgi:phosphoribosylformylglycinamidine synthase
MELQVQKAVSKLIKNKFILTAHDVSEGGLLVCLFEACLGGTLGFDLVSMPGIRKDSFLFGEGQSRIVIGVDPIREDDVVQALAGDLIPYIKLGRTRQDGIFTLDNEPLGSVTEWNNKYASSLEHLMESQEEPS